MPMLFQTIQDPAIYSIQWLRDHGPRIGLLIALALLVSWLGRRAVRRFRRRLEGAGEAGLTGAVSLHRSTTLVGIMASAVRVTVWTVVALMVLRELGFDLAPLLAGAGVAGIALGFGAQSLVRDFLAGFFILLESQFGVGESVELMATGGAVSGRVESLTLRSTSVRALDGTLSVVPNGNIQFASNKSRGVGEITVDVRVPAGLDLEAVRARLDQLVEDLRRDGRLRARVATGPVAVGVEPAGDGDEMVVTVAAGARPSRQAEVESEIRRRLEQGLRDVPRPDGTDATG